MFSNNLLSLFDVKQNKPEFAHLGIDPFLIDIFEAGFAGNIQQLELLALTIVRKLKGDKPEVVAALTTILADRRTALRAGRGLQPGAAPTDQDSTLPLVKIESTEGSPKPIFDEATDLQLGRILKERRNSETLLAEGICPPRSLLLKGPPGTGKTMFAKWLASELRLHLVSLDLASAISSFLGKTGMNLRRALDYARSSPCVLLLDEFDAVAKRRDDSTEVGELKRIVNVLLKELEDWPAHSMLIAATNHPELLDPAISRRFDRVLNTSLPSEQERSAILCSALGRFASVLSGGLIDSLSGILNQTSGSDIQRMTDAAIRRHLVEGEGIDRALMAEVAASMGEEGKNKKVMGRLIRALKNQLEDKVTVRDLAALARVAPSTVQYHLKRG